jgi:hypothetical protein
LPVTNAASTPVSALDDRAASRAASTVSELSTRDAAAVAAGADDEALEGARSSRRDATRALTTVTTAPTASSANDARAIDRGRALGARVWAEAGSDDDAVGCRTGATAGADASPHAARANSWTPRFSRASRRMSGDAFA